MYTLFFLIFSQESFNSTISHCIRADAFYQVLLQCLPAEDKQQWVLHHLQNIIKRNHLQIDEHFIRDPRDALRIP